MTDQASGTEATRLDAALDRLRRGALARIEEIASAGRPASESPSSVDVGERSPVPQAEVEDRSRFRAAASGTGAGAIPSSVLPPVSPATTERSDSAEAGLSHDATTTAPMDDPFPRPGQSEQTGGIPAASPSRLGFWGRLLQSRWLGGG